MNETEIEKRVEDLVSSLNSLYTHKMISAAEKMKITRRITVWAYDESISSSSQGR